MKRCTALTLILSFLICTGTVFAQYFTDFQAVYPFNRGQNQTKNYTLTKDQAWVSPNKPGYMLMTNSIVAPSIISLSALKLNPDFTISLTRSYIPPSSVNSYTLISNDVYATSEGGYVVCGRVTYDASGWAFIAVFDTKATPIWYKEYYNISTLNTIVEVPKTISEKVRYIACGTKYNSTSATGIMLGVDFELLPVWQNNTLLNSRTDRFVYNDIIAFKNPDINLPILYAVVGNSFTQPYNNKDVLLTAIDFKGNTIFSYIYGLKNDTVIIFDEEGYGLAISPKDQIVITGRTKCYYPSTSAVKWDDVLLLAVDFNGKPDWIYRYDIPKNNKTGEYAQKVLVKDDFLYVSGYYRSYVFTNNSSYDAFIFETYLDGKPNYVRIYGGSGADLFFVQEVNFDKDGVVSAGFSNSFTFNAAGLPSYSPYIVESYRNIKDSCHSQFYKLPYYKTDLKVNKINSFFSPTSYVKKELIEIKNPADMKVLCPKIPLISPSISSSELKSAKEQMETTNEVIKLQPNPVQNELKITGIEQNSSYEIYSINGKLMKQGILNSTSLNVANLPKGMYFISVKNNQTIAIIKFLKE